MGKLFPKATVHGVALAIMTYGYQSLGGLSVDKFIREQYGGHFQYLTIQGLVLAWLSVLTSLLNEVSASPSFKGLRTLKRYLMLMALPLSVVISIIYWPLVLFMPQLMLQSISVSDQSPPSSSVISVDLFRIPLNIDLALHAAPCLFLLFDFFFFEEKYSDYEVDVGAPFATIGFSLWYSLWVELCGEKNNGTFPYPFLTENTLGVRIGIYLSATLLALITVRIINRLHR